MAHLTYSQASPGTFLYQQPPHVLSPIYKAPLTQPCDPHTPFLTYAMLLRTLPDQCGISYTFPMIPTQGAAFYLTYVAFLGHTHTLFLN